MIARTEKQTYIESTIARKPVTISGNDATTQVGADLAIRIHDYLNND